MLKKKKLHTPILELAGGKHCTSKVRDLCPGTMEATAEGKGKVHVKTKQRDDLKVHGYISMYSNLDPHEDWP